MKASAIAIALFAIVSASSATAADLTARKAVYKAPPPVVDLWTGLYVGGNVGYGAGGWDSSSNQRVFNFDTTAANPNVRGVAAGIQLGYNWRFAPQWIIGVEADLVDPLKAGQTWNDPGIAACGDCIPEDFVPRPGGPASLSHEWKLRWFSSLRARLGFTPVDNWMFYVTGGPAVGESSYEFRFSQPGAAALPAPSYYALTTRPTNYGFAVGAGAETKINANWSIRAEYLYLDLGKTTVDALDIDNFPFHVEYRLRSNFARIGINYQFH